MKGCIITIYIYIYIYTIVEQTYTMGHNSNLIVSGAPYPKPTRDTTKRETTLPLNVYEIQAAKSQKVGIFRILSLGFTQRQQNTRGSEARTP